MIEQTREYIKRLASNFGATNDSTSKSYIERNNTKEAALHDEGAYFGLISPEEEASGPYHDFSFVVFPALGSNSWLIAIGVGSLGFKNDYDLARYPGLSRFFSSLIDDKGFCKTDFADIETSIPRTFLTNSGITHLKNTINRYSKVLQACQVIDDPTSEIGLKKIGAFVAGYARMRDWPTNESHRKALSDSLKIQSDKIDDFAELLSLVKERKYVIIEGAPGTGKTRLAKQISDKLGAKTFFTQFHAETTYSDFIFGLQPVLNSESLKYAERKGILIKAIEWAINNPSQSAVLLIDEINRANLSNVLGPIFYLFEHKQDISNVEIEIAPGLVLNQMPSNLFVVATMNTADRSLAVVDFALRRRFAWYQLKPRSINSSNFFSKDFNILNEIFQWHASSNELSLQPGQGYFLADNEDEMINRIRYELMPLIREYLQEGILLTAKEEFNNYFLSRINASLFE